MDEKSFEAEVSHVGHKSANGLVYSQEILQGITESSHVLRRVKRGKLRGEVDHPRLVPGEDYDNYRRRWQMIDESRVSHQLSNLRMEGDKLMATVKPAGPFGSMLVKMYEEHPESVKFGIRGLAHDVDKDCKITKFDLVTVDLIP